MLIIAPTDGLHQPTLNLRVVETLESDLLQIGERKRAYKRLIMRAHLSRHVAERSALPDFGRMQGVAACEGEAGIAVTRRHVAHAEARDLIRAQRRRLLIAVLEYV